jgi:hypothetical protein
VHTLGQANHRDGDRHGGDGELTTTTSLVTTVTRNQQARTQSTSLSPAELEAQRNEDVLMRNSSRKADASLRQAAGSSGSGLSVLSSVVEDMNDDPLGVPSPPSRTHSTLSEQPEPMSGELQEQETSTLLQEEVVAKRVELLVHQCKALELSHKELESKNAELARKLQQATRARLERVLGPEPEPEQEPEPEADGDVVGRAAAADVLRNGMASWQLAVRLYLSVQPLPANMRTKLSYPKPSNGAPEALSDGTACACVVPDVEVCAVVGGMGLGQACSWRRR